MRLCHFSSSSSSSSHYPPSLTSSPLCCSPPPCSARSILPARLAGSFLTKRCEGGTKCFLLSGNYVLYASAAPAPAATWRVRRQVSAETRARLMSLSIIFIEPPFPPPPKTWAKSGVEGRKNRTLEGFDKRQQPPSTPVHAGSPTHLQHTEPLIQPTWLNLSAGFSWFLLLLLKAAHQSSDSELTLKSICCISEEEDEEET